MAEQSRFWTTSGTGDGPGGGYSAAQFQEFVRELLMIDPTTEAVLGGLQNELAVTGTSTPVVVATGNAIVYGVWYDNDSALNVTVPTPTTSTRIDRIILRFSSSAQTVRVVRLAGTEGGGAPALTQNSTTWEVSLAQISVTTGGVITVTDQRSFVRTPGGRGLADGTMLEWDAASKRLRIKDAGVSTAKIADGAVSTAKVADGAITAAKIANDTITAAQIAANAITASELADNAVDTAAVANLAVTLGKLADNSVDDTKAGDRVPQFYRRQGASASDWSLPGTSAQTPTAVRMQGGSIEVSVSASPVGSISVTFPVAFSNKPLVYVSITEDISTTYIASVTAVSASAITIQVLNYEGTSLTNVVTVNWLAIGPE